jgi:acyl-CoA reductase-like NAD-dependent aldehyde dehydrogenase
MNGDSPVETRLRGDCRVAPFIDGRLTTSFDEATIEILNPSNGQTLLSIPSGCDADVDCAVNSSRRAFADRRWSDVAPTIRKKALHRLADLIVAQAQRLDQLDAGEMGKPISEVVSNASAAGEVVRFYAEAADKVMGDSYAGDPHSLVVQRRIPRGVVAAVVPWNFPTFNAALKLAPALAAGNCVVLKPSESASRSSMELAKLALEAGIPAGVLNLVPGSGETVGQALGLHPDVDILSFTGSTAVGKLMLQYAGRSNMKVVLAECGGKSSHVVFGDGVDVRATGEAIAAELLVNQGQMCSVGARLLVQRSVEKPLIEVITARLRRIEMGDALDPKTTFGPLVSARQCARVMQYIETAQAGGAELVIGGQRARRDSGGYFVEPTLFRNVKPEDRIAQEEIFGPVLSVISFEDEDDAIRIANGTAYGLAATVWTSQLSTGMTMAKGIRSSVMINAVPPIGEGPGYSVASEPFGQSGLGVEGGIAGMESYLRRQVVWFNHA